MPNVPFLRTPITDLSGGLCTHQNYGKCREIEMKMINCFEAYGMNRATKLCSDIIDDYKECFNRAKQKNRLKEMEKERHRQYKDGKKMNDLYLPDEPRLDAFKY